MYPGNISKCLYTVQHFCLHFIFLIWQAYSKTVHLINTLFVGVWSEFHSFRYHITREKSTSRHLSFYPADRMVLY